MQESMGLMIGYNGINLTQRNQQAHKIGFKNVMGGFGNNNGGMSFRNNLGGLGGGLYNAGSALTQRSALIGG